MIYKVGSRGDEVKKIQLKLGIDADGYFGPITRGAVIAYQKLNKLDPDGIVGPLTWNKLFGPPVPKPPITGNPNPNPKTNPYTVEDHLLYKDGNPVSWKRSPNVGGVIEPELIVIHYTGDNGTGGLQWLTDPSSKVSAHLWIAKTGVVWQLVPFNIRAWHAGASSYNGRGDCNSWSIGIENQGMGTEPWPKAQMQANAEVIIALYRTYNIEYVVGHEDVAPGRKVDPGKFYDWDYIFSELTKAGFKLE